MVKYCSMKPKVYGAWHIHIAMYSANVIAKCGCVSTQREQNKV